MSEKLSTRFSKVFNDLPSEAQKTLLEKSLADVLDNLPPDVARKVYSSALKVQTRHENVPKLDLRAKRQEVNALLDLLTRESKMSMFGDRARRQETMSELMHTLTGWLNDVWSAFYEHHVQYSTAHHCLLFVAEVLTQLETLPNPAGCKCEVMNMPVRVTIKDKNGACMTKLRVRGPQHTDRLLLWIWRDLCLCLLSRGLKDDTKTVANILQDLEHLYGFPVLHKLLCGGKRSTLEEEEEDEEDQILLDDETYSDTMEDDFDDMFFGFHNPSASFTSSHWKPANKFLNSLVLLRKMVEDLLFDLFALAPSLPLHDAIMDIAVNPSAAALRSSAILSEVAGTTSDTLAGAISIEVAHNNATKLAALLDAHSHLLRPRDAVPLQCAAAVFGDTTTHSARGIALLERGLNDTLLAIQSAVRNVYTRVEEPAQQKELLEIIKLRSGTSARRDRIDAWVQSIMGTSENGMGGPMAFAAMMFGMMGGGGPGMPPIPGLGVGGGPGEMGAEPADLLSFIDFEGAGSDADLEDLREEFRPKLKQWLEGWTQLAGIMKGGAPVAVKAYVKVVEIMPYMRATDVVNEMVSRLSERPGKAHVCDALESLSSFCKSQRKKINTVRKEKEKQAASKDKASPSSSVPATAAGTPSTTPGAGPSTAPAPSTASSTAAQTQSNHTPAPAPPTPGAQATPPAPPPNSISMGFFSIPYPFIFGGGSPSPPETPAAAAPAPSASAGTSAGASTSGGGGQEQTHAHAHSPDSPFRIFQGMEDVD